MSKKRKFEHKRGFKLEHNLGLKKMLSLAPISHKETFFSRIHLLFIE